MFGSTGRSFGVTARRTGSWLTTFARLRRCAQKLIGDWPTCVVIRHSTHATMRLCKLVGSGRSFHSRLLHCHIARLMA